MRNIRVIIAFLSIYLFVGALTLLLLFCMWLERYYPDSSTQSIITIQAEQSIRGVSNFEVLQIDHGASALTSTITRINENNATQKLMTSIESQSLFLDFQRVTFSEKLVPLGYFSMTRPLSINTAESTTIFTSNPTWLDAMWEFLLRKWVTKSTESITIVAKTNTTSYTVRNTPEGVKLYEN